MASVRGRCGQWSVLRVSAVYGPPVEPSRWCRHVSRHVSRIAACCALVPLCHAVTFRAMYVQSDELVAGRTVTYPTPFIRRYCSPIAFVVRGANGSIFH